MTKIYSGINTKVQDDSKEGSTVKDYIMLMKPRVMSLVVFTAFCGLWIAPGEIHPIIGFASILFVTIAAGASAAINMWYDRDIDAIMKRTQQRPIITGRVEPDEALSFGVITGVLSVLLMALCVNIVSAALLAFTILYYVFIYTMWLKRSSINNVVIGGVSGALPPMIGWASVTNDISLQSFSLFAIIFMWTPPHSWALALFRLQDYKDCNVPMMPVVKGELYTKKQIVIYSVLMAITVSMPYFLNIANIMYLFVSTIMSIAFLYYVILLFKNGGTAPAKKLFWFSILYLFVVFLSLIVLKI
ncbi:MAG: heme o synthase [Rickettsiaceae bacterium]|nr:heme o synthase [Rickettsiaceae bacterium]